MLSKEELEAYCRKYYVTVYNYCFRYLSNKEDAEDATQNTFVVFNEKGPALEDQHVVLWLLRTAHYMVLKECKQRNRKNNNECVFDEEILEASQKFASLDDYIVSYYGERFAEEVYNRLPDKDKEVFDLYSDGTLKPGTISEILGIDISACSMRKKRLKEKCREILIEILFY